MFSKLQWNHNFFSNVIKQVRGACSKSRLPLDGTVQLYSEEIDSSEAPLRHFSGDLASECECVSVGGGSVWWGKLLVYLVNIF